MKNIVSFIMFVCLFACHPAHATSMNFNNSINGLTGPVTIAAGSNITVTVLGQTITLASTGGGSSPLTTKGDIWGFSTVDARVPVGTNGFVLTADSTQALGVKWAAAAGTGTVTSVSVVSANGLAGTVATSTTTPAITLSTSITGILKGNGTAISAATAGTDYQAPITTGNLTDAGTDGITVTGGTAAVIGSGTSLSQHVSDATHAGYLASADWSTFNNKQSALTPGSISTSTTGVTVGSGGSSTVGPNVTVNVQTASGSQPGLLSSADWTTFNGKQSSGNYVTALTGDVTASGPGSVAATVAAIMGTTVSATTGSVNVVFSNGPTLSNPIVGTQSASDNSTKAASTAYVTSAIATAVAGVNPAVAVQAATTAAGDTSSLTYSNGASGIGATLIGSVNTALTVDGYTFTALGQRLLVKNDTQSPSGAFNGIYYVTQVQTAILPLILTRALDYDQPSDINNTGAIPVINGTVNATTSWVETAQVNTVGTDPLSFTEFTRNPGDYLLKANNLSDVNSKTTSFNNISPMTTGGDLIYGGASGAGTRLANGTSGQVLTSGGGTAAPTWTTISGTGTVTSVAETVPAFLSISGSPVTTSGTLAIGLSGSALPTTSGGTGTNTVFTQGSVIFADSSGNHAQDNANFFWDATNHRLGIGTTSPSFGFDIVQDTSSATQVIQQTGYGVNNIGWRGRHARGTSGSPTATQSGDFLSFISGRGYGATGFAAGATAGMNMLATANFTDSSMPTALSFLVTPSGSVTSAEAMRIAPTGDVLVGTTTDSTGLLQVNGSVYASSANLSGLTASLPVFTDSSKNLSTPSIATARTNLGIFAGASFLTSGTTIVTPSTITTSTQVKITLIGAGGGSGGVAATANQKSPGGGAGAVAVFYLTGLTPSTSYTYAIGAAGTAGTNAPTAGGTGGTTSITIGGTTYSASGGVGGVVGVSGATGAAGGTTTNIPANSIIVNGQQGGSIGTNSANTAPATGGSSGMGLGFGGVGPLPGTSAAGVSGTGYGAGASGATAGAGSVNAGGAGTQGAILIEFLN